MIRSFVGREAVFSVAALLISAILIQTLYATVIRPRAAAILAEPAIPQEQLRPGQPVTHNLRSVFVILKDYEQEVALILATWALCLIGYQAGEVARNRRLLVAGHRVSSSATLPTTFAAAAR
jgi:hypothetical protein